MSVEIRYLSQEEVIQVGGLDMALTVEDVQEVYRLYSLGECVKPHKAVLRWGDLDSERTSRGHVNAMPGYVGGKYDMAGQKWVGGFYQNPSRYGLPSITALVILNDPHNGLPLAVMEGSLISAMRTGAQGGVAARFLARPDSRTIGVIGAGVQSRALLMACKEVLPGLSTALVYDVNEERSRAFCQEMSERLDMSVRVAKTAKATVSASDILASATSAVSPVLKRGWVPEGCLYLQMGAYECELEAVLDFDKVIVDDWAEVQHREVPVLAMAKKAGVITDQDIYAEVGEIVLDKKPARENDTERIFFHAVGLGLLDIAVATRLLRRAEEEEVGTLLPLWEAPVFV